MKISIENCYNNLICIKIELLKHSQYLEERKFVLDQLLLHKYFIWYYLFIKVKYCKRFAQKTWLIHINWNSIFKTQHLYTWQGLSTSYRKNVSYISLVIWNILHFPHLSKCSVFLSHFFAVALISLQLNLSYILHSIILLFSFWY